MTRKLRPEGFEDSAGYMNMDFMNDEEKKDIFMGYGAHPATIVPWQQFFDVLHGVQWTLNTTKP